MHPYTTYPSRGKSLIHALSLAAITAALCFTAGCTPRCGGESVNTNRTDRGPVDNAPAVEKLREGKLFDGRSLSGWRIATQDTYAGHGQVTVKDGAILLAEGTPATGVAVVGEVPRMDYELTLQAQRVEGNDFFCGLTFPVGPSHCTLILGGWGGGTTGLSNVDGMPADENETSGYMDFKNGHWYKIRLRVTQSRIEAWADGQQIVQLDTKDREFSVWWEQEPVRPLGVGTWYTSAALRDIHLRRLEDETKNEETMTNE